MKKILLSLLLLAAVACTKNNDGPTDTDNDPESGGGLSQEAVELHTALESKLESDEFQNYGSMEELASAVQDWLAAQPELVKHTVSADGSITLDFGGGVTTRIEFTEETEPQEPEPVSDDDLPLIDAGIFDKATKSKAAPGPIRAADAETAISTRYVSPAGYQPDYIFPVLWEPCYEEGASDLAAVMPFYTPGNKLFKSSCGIRKIPIRHVKDIQCIPEQFGVNVNGLVDGYKPNVIIIATHGRDGKYLYAGCYETSGKYKKSAKYQDKTTMVHKVIEKEGGTTISRVYQEADPDIVGDLLGEWNLTNAIVFINACESVNPHVFDATIATALQPEEPWGPAYIYGYSDRLQNPRAANITNAVLKCLLVGIKRSSMSAVSPVMVKDALGYVVTNVTDGKNLYGTGSDLDFKFKNTVSLCSPQTRAEASARPGCRINFWERGGEPVYYGIVYSATNKNPELGDSRNSFSTWDELDRDVYSPEDNSIFMRSGTYWSSDIYNGYMAGLYNAPLGCMLWISVTDLGNPSDDTFTYATNRTSVRCVHDQI